MICHARYFLPRVTLTLFILASVCHFGDSDTTGNPATMPLDILTKGGTSYDLIEGRLVGSLKGALLYILFFAGCVLNILTRPALC